MLQSLSSVLSLALIIKALRRLLLGLARVVCCLLPPAPSWDAMLAVTKLKSSSPLLFSLGRGTFWFDELSMVAIKEKNIIKYDTFFQSCGDSFEHLSYNRLSRGNTQVYRHCRLAYGQVALLSLKYRKNYSSLVNPVIRRHSLADSPVQLSYPPNVYTRSTLH